MLTWPLSFDPQYGARPLRRLVQRRIQNALATALLEGRFKDGDRVVVKTDAKGELLLEKG